MEVVSEDVAAEKVSEDATEDAVVEDVEVKPDPSTVEDVEADPNQSNVEDVVLEDSIVVEDVNDEDEEDEVPTPKKTVSETYNEYDTLNEQKPIWRRNRDTITDEEYASFYKAFSNDYGNYLEKVHFNVEGSFQFNALVFVPERQPFNMFQQSKDKKSNIKLYVRRVFITDDCKDILPEYLSFVSGVVDSDDLPLNVSRELLQQSKSISVIKKQLVKRVVKTLVSLSENDRTRFGKFYNSYHKNIKLGIYEDSKNRDALASLLLYPTTTSGSNKHSLDQYIENMKDDQPGIYYVTGEGREILENSPFIEKLKQEGYEVIFMVDPIDEYMVQQLKTYKTHKLICVTKANLTMKEDESEVEEFKVLEEEYRELCEHIKNVLGDEVENVVVSNRIVKSPSCLVTNEYGWSANMERIMKAQALQNKQMHSYMMSKKIMEINPKNRIVRSLKERYTKDKKDKTVHNLIWVLYEQSLIVSGFSLKNPIHFTNRLNNILEISLGCDQLDETELDDSIEEPDSGSGSGSGSGSNDGKEKFTEMEEVD